MATTPVPKYRPYLSIEEMDALIWALDNVALTGSSYDADLQSAAQSLLKTRTLAGLALKEPAYTTNPRKTLSDKLGDFTSMSPAGLNIEAPDFDAMMAQLAKEPGTPEDTK